MHLHILGICGTFMGGIAALARAAGHRVTGCDTNVYPPMSTQLAELGIDVIEGWDAAQMRLAPDVYVVGNVVSRGNPLMEAILDAGAAYTSGPQWLSENVLAGRRVIAVAGTHGKTTTSSLIAWLLDQASLSPGFLIGGVPANFGVSARLGDGDLFVVEADEYDTAFFDKRAKFVHYRPRIAVLNNLEFDHADIYSDLAAIEWQFHQLLRCVPGGGYVLVNQADQNLARVVEAGCWSTRRCFAAPADAPDAADLALRPAQSPGQAEIASERGWRAFETPLTGDHNLQNTAAALLVARTLGIPDDVTLPAIAGFRSVKRRLERLGERDGIEVFDDFAHHPTAIAMTLAGMRRAHPQGRLLAAFEPRSNTMRRGVHATTLAPAFAEADQVLILRPSDIDWDLESAFAEATPDCRLFDEVDALFETLVGEMRQGDRLVLMSNGGFGGLSGRLSDWLQQA